MKAIFDKSIRFKLWHDTWIDKPKPVILDPRDAVVRVTLGSICTSDPGKIDTTPLITHRYKLDDIGAAYHLFENKLDGVIKVAITP